MVAKRLVRRAIPPPCHRRRSDDRRFMTAPTARRQPARQGRRALAVRAAARAAGRHPAGQARDQSVGRRAAASDPAVRRAGAAGASQRFRPLSGQQGHRRLPPGRRRLARPPLQAAAPGRSARPRSSCSTAPARACSSARIAAKRYVAQRAGKPAILIPNPFYAAYSAGAAAAECEPVYLPTTRETGFLPDLDAIDEALLARTVAFYIASPSNPQGAVADRGLSRAAGRAGAPHGFLIFADECYCEIYLNGRAPHGMLQVVRRRTSPTSWCSTRCRSARTCPACASASPPATAASSPATSSCATSRRRRCRCRRRRSPSRPTATRRMSRRTASSTSPSSISPTRSSATATATSGPAGGFFLWLDVSRARRRRGRGLKLWREGGLRVIPGHYLARDGADGRNPGEGYIRVAMVQDKEITAEALHRLVAVLG